MKDLVCGAIAATLALSPQPLPRHWDRLLEDEPLEPACALIVQPLIWQVTNDRHERANSLLEEKDARLLTDAEAADLLSVTPQEGQPAADAAFKASLDELARRVSQVEASGSPDSAEQRFLARMNTHFGSGRHRHYRPYLVKSVALAGPPVEGQPLLTAQYCDGSLTLTSMFFADTIPETRRVPTVIFLPSEPLDIDAYMTVSS